MKKLRIALILFSVFITFSCGIISNTDKKTSEPAVTFTTISDASGLPFDPSSPSSKVSVIISVTDADFNAVTGTELEINGTLYPLGAGITEKTLDNIPVNEAPNLVVRAPGYKTEQLNVNPLDSHSGIQVILLPMEVTQTLTAAAGSVQAKSGSITFASNVLDDGSGGAYTGNTDVSMRVTDANRDFLDDNGKIEAKGSDMTVLTKDGSGNVAMSVNLATMDVKVTKEGTSESLNLLPGQTTSVSMIIDKKFVEDFPGLTAGTNLPLVTYNETNGNWDKGSSTCTLVNTNGIMSCNGAVDKLGKIAVSYQTSYGCVKAEISMSVPAGSTIVSRKYSLAEGYQVHTFDSNGKVGIVALVPTDSAGAVVDKYKLLSEFNLQATSEMSEPVDPFAGVFYMQTDELPLTKVTASLNGTESSSMDATLAVCSMAPTAVTVKANPVDTTIPDSDIGEAFDDSNSLLAASLFPQLHGEWSTGCTNDGTDSTIYYYFFNSYNELNISMKQFGGDITCNPATKVYEMNMMMKLSDGSPSTVSYNSIDAFKTNTLHTATALILTDDYWVTAYNGISYYGYSDWEKGVAKDLFGKNPSDGTPVPIPSMLYSIAWTDGTVLYFGEADVTNDGSTDVKRYQNLDLTLPFYKQ